MSSFPLETTDGDLRKLCQALWSWHLCQGCYNGERCTTSDCPWQRARHLVRFFEYYKYMTTTYETDAGPGGSPALSSHENLLEIVTTLRSDPDVTRTQLKQKMFENPTGRRKPSSIDQDRAINLAVRIMVMVSCSAQAQSSALLEHGTHQIRWHNNATFSQFIEDVFPATNYPGLNNDDTGSSLDIKTALTANKLKKRAGLKFRPTDDLRSHLRLDQRNGVVEIYHHTAFLKEHLRITKDTGRLSISETLKL